jgi:hypothetical protein
MNKARKNAILAGMYDLIPAITAATLPGVTVTEAILATCKQFHDAFDEHYQIVWSDPRQDELVEAFRNAKYLLEFRNRMAQLTKLQTAWSEARSSGSLAATVQAGAAFVQSLRYDIVFQKAPEWLLTRQTANIGTNYALARAELAADVAAWWALLLSRPLADADTFESIRDLRRDNSLADLDLVEPWPADWDSRVLACLSKPRPDDFVHVPWVRNMRTIRSWVAVAVNTGDLQLARKLLVFVDADLGYDKYLPAGAHWDLVKLVQGDMRPEGEA